VSGPVVYECTVRHTRSSPVRHSFAYRTHQWLVDLDRLPSRRLLASFEARDHFGDPHSTIRANVDDYLLQHGIELAGGHVLMLANARSLGYVFNPLTVFWCHRPDGTLAATIAEVHNTFGERHCYLLHPDERGRALTDKEFYVSPFLTVNGRYRLTLPIPGERLSLAITLEQPGTRPFVATLTGRRRAPTLRTLLRDPLVTYAVTARIWWQGVRLYLRGLPVVPR